MSRPSTNGAVDGNTIRWDVKNWNGEEPSEVAQLSIRYVDPTTPQIDTENISLEFEIDARNIKNTSLKTTIITRHADIQRYTILPEFITNLDVIPADGIRLFVDNGLFSWDDLYQGTLEHIIESVISVIENSSFNQTLDIAFRWNPETTINCTIPYNLSHMDAAPAIHAELLDEDIAVLLCDTSVRAVFGLAHAGATANLTADDVNFGDGLADIGYPYNGTLRLPENVLLSGANRVQWNDSHPISGMLTSASASQYLEEHIETHIAVEIDTLELNLPSLFTGKTDLTATVYVEENINTYVTQLPEELTLPEKIDLDYMNADAFRLCVEERVFSTDAVEAFLTHKKDSFETQISGIVHGLTINGYLDRNTFFESLTWDGDVSSMEETVPVVISSYAHSFYSAPFTLSLIPPSITVSDQSFTLSGFNNQSVSYRIIFPKGINVEARDATNNTIPVGKTADARDYIEIIFAGDESDKTTVVTCTLTAAPLYVLGLFLPCILSFILVVVLIIVVLLIRKKRKQDKAFRGGEAEAPAAEGYEDQDYYVPPPPQS
jgi:hypothetical protein